MVVKMAIYEQRSQHTASSLPAVKVVGPHSTKLRRNVCCTPHLPSTSVHDEDIGCTGAIEAMPLPGGGDGWL